MYFRPAIPALFVAFVFMFCAGCQKPEFSTRVLPPTVLSPDTIASVHWAGKHRLGYEATAFYFCRIWSLPETARLQAQTYDRLATNAWRLLLGGQAGARIPAALLRPLLDELTERESYLEVRAATGAPPSFVLATRVSGRSAGIWETNLAIAAELLADAPVVPDPAGHGWALQRTNPPKRIRLTHVGDWTVLSAGPWPNGLSEDMAARIRRDGVPFVSAGSNLWLEASLDPVRLVVVFPASLSVFRAQISGIQSLGFSISGDGANVIAHAHIKFIKPLPESSQSWQLPVPLLHEPLASFTAVREVQPWLAVWQPWLDLPLGTAPDQLFFWSLAGSPFQVYLAAPLPGVRLRVSSLTGWLLQNGNPWLAAHGYISFDPAPDGNGVIWGSLPAIKPFIKAAGDTEQGWLYAGLLPDPSAVAIPPPTGLVQDILQRTNAVYYDWEATGSRLQLDLELGQTARLVARRPQMSLDSASLNWLAVLMPRLGTSITIVSRTGSAGLDFYRRSTLGLTAPELHLLADWLESPQFPCGLHSTVTQ